ncbi:cell division suppressor protein YneA [Bacillus dakarensis]|uniref:cell division suppressor protein YneA n=1 Tax=Robertmurraya dakarensis TaxID=1926278 RepID=UPI000981AADB|nr:LysM peptidoglycan-binding domain-containing protein [Bacillus dakarensis]
MRKIWKRHSYAIILILLSFSITLILSEKSSDETDEYIAIKVMEGETIWEISERYAEEHGLSPNQFINWVKKTNEIDEYILAGESIIIPVSKEKLYANNYASIEKNDE